jgi:phospholipid/cholesterol/gamma-HCH transport system permease protein
MDNVVFKRADVGALCVELAGTWQLGTAAPSPEDVHRELSAEPSARHLEFRSDDVADWDSSLLIFVRRVLGACGDLGIDVDREGLPKGVRSLLLLAEAVPEKETGAVAATPSMVVRTGIWAAGAAEEGRDMLTFVGEATLAFGRLLRGKARFPVADFFAILDECGPKALGIVGLVSMLVGLILAFMGAIQLRMFGAEIYVADLVAIGMARDMGAIMVGIIMAGRTGAAFAAQLGTMTVNEEIDALATMGISAMEYLVLPRMLALMLVMPLLTLYGDVLGILGGALVGIGPLGLGFRQYMQETMAAVTLTYFAAGLFKGTVYGVIVALAGCYRGMKCGRSAAAVGEATTSAVVLAIVFIILSCGVLTIVYDVLGI